MSATQGAKDVERMKVVGAFNKDLKEAVLRWFAAPKGKDGGRRSRPKEERSWVSLLPAPTIRI